MLKNISSSAFELLLLFQWMAKKKNDSLLLDRYEIFAIKIREEAFVIKCAYTF